MQPAALHVAASEPPDAVPYVEYLLLHQPRIQFFHQRQYSPEEGMVALPDAPGLGIELDESKIETRRELQF